MLHGSIRSSRITRVVPRNAHDPDLQPTTDRSPGDRHVLLCAGHRCAGQGLAFLRENDGITLRHRQRGIPRKARRAEKTSGLCASGIPKTTRIQGTTTMNATYTKRWAAWNWMPPRERKRTGRRQLGFALYEAGRRQGLPAPVANAHARFEYEARQAARDWLMV